MEIDANEVIAHYRQALAEETDRRIKAEVVAGLLQRQLAESTDDDTASDASSDRDQD